MKQDPSFVKKIGQVVLLGGAFSVNGNVNPAAEANVSLNSLFPLSLIDEFHVYQVTLNNFMQSCSCALILFSILLMSLFNILSRKLDH